MIKEDIIKSLLNISEKEICAAIDEYKKYNYPTSIYLIQQSVEKAYKAVGLYSQQIELVDLKKVGHDYFKLLKLTLSSLAEESKSHAFNLGVEQFSMTPPNANEVFNTIMNATRSDFFNLEEPILQNLLEILRSHLKALPAIYTSDEKIKTLVDIAYKSGKLSSEQMREIENEYEKGIPEEYTKAIKDYHRHSLVLNFLGLLTSPHCEQTRYPQASTEYKCPTEIYTNKFPLVKYQPQLMQMASEAISFMKSNISTID